jgi:hypothetical protein
MSNSHLSPGRAEPLECHQIPRDENAFVDWLVRAKAGDALAYYRGHLAFDRDPLQTTLGEFRRLKLTHLADRAMECCERRQVLLVQRRVGKNDWTYLAIRSGEPLMPARHRQVNSSVRSMTHA